MEIVVIAQIIGYIGLFLLILRFFYDRRRVMVGLSALGNFVYAIHWFLLGGLTGAGTTFIASIRNAIFMERTSKKWAESIYWLYLFLVINVIITILTWDGNISLLPMIASFFTAFALWAKKTLHIRVLLTLSAVGWLVYAYILGSQAVIIYSIITFISGLFNIMRFDWKWFS